MKRKLISTIVLFLIFQMFAYTQGLQINENNIKKAEVNKNNDSIKFVYNIELLVKANSRDKCEQICFRIDKTRNLKWIKAYSSEIVNKFGNTYIKNSSYAALLALTNIPDSIKNSILNQEHGFFLAKARLGDTSEIKFFINEYIKERDMDDIHFKHGRLKYELNLLLSINNSEIIKLIFSDIESIRIIEKEESPAPGHYNNVYYTLPYSIIMALRDKHYYEPIFQEEFMFQFLDAETPQKVNPNINEYYKLVEEFILREYNVKIKINTPYLIAGWPAYGYF